MKKITYKILFLFVATLLFTQYSYAQKEGSLRDRIAQKQDKSQKGKTVIPRMSVRAEMKNNQQTRDLSNATWIREVYRELQLDKGSNAALMNPVEPIGSRMNLFTLIFKLMAQGDLEAYDFLDGREVFTDQFKVDFKDVLERLDIPFGKIGDVYTFNDMDIPSNEVLAYYIKEVWYFDQSNSIVGTEVVAICPVLFRADDIEMPAAKTPQFWVPYENIRPYAARMPIMTSDYNNVVRKTIDDYFKLCLYDGEIYKTTNMENKVLIEKYESEEDLKQARERIENEIVTFKDSLWVINDSTFVDSDNKKHKITRGTKAQSGKTVKGGKTKATKSKKAKVSTPKVKKGKAPKSAPKGKSQARFSARDRR